MSLTASEKDTIYAIAVKAAAASHGDPEWLESVADALGVNVVAAKEIEDSSKSE